MAVADELVTILGVDIAKNAMAKLESFKNGVDSVKKTLMGLSVVITGAAATMGLMVKGAADEAMELQKLSDKTGISTDALQEWGYAAKKSGLDAKAVTNDLANLQKTMSSPIPGQFNQTLAMFGVSARDASGKLKTTDQVLTDMAGKFQGMSQQKAAQWASKLGISDDTLLLLRKGKDGIEDLRKEAHKLGGIIPSESIKRAADFKRQLAELQFAFHGLTSQVAIAMIPALSRIVDIFKGWMESNREWISLGLEALMGGIVNGFERFWNVLKKTGGMFDPIVDAIKPFLGDMDMMELVTHLVTGALTGLLIIFSPLLAKLALIGVAVVVISQLFEDFFTYLEGGDSVIGDLFNAFQERWPELFSALSKLWDWLKSNITPALEMVWNGIKYVCSAWADVGAKILDVLNSLAGPVAEFFSTFEERFPALAKALKAFANFLGTVFKGAFDLVIGNIKNVIDIIGGLLGWVGKAITKLAEFLDWLFTSEDASDKAGKGAISPPRSSTVRVNGQPAQMQMAASHGQGGMQYTDNRTINQNISTSDPQQAGQAALDGFSGQPPATPGSWPPSF